MPQVPGQAVDYRSVIERDQDDSLVPPAAPPPSLAGNPYADMMRTERESRDRAAAVALLEARDRDPDAYAQTQRLAREANLPLGAVELDPDGVQTELRMNRISEALQRSPLLQAWAAQDDNAILAMDDFENLSGIEVALQAVGDVAFGVPRGFNRAFGEGLSGLGRLNDAASRWVSSSLRDAGADAVADVLDTPIPWWMNPSNWARGAGELISDTSPALPEDRRNFATDVSEGLGTLIGQAVISRVNPSAGVAAMGGMGAEEAGSRAEQAGATQEQIDQAAVLGAGITATVEKLGLDAILNRLPPKVKNRAVRWVVDKAVAGGIEGGQEAIEQIAHNLVAGMVYDPDAPVFEGVGDAASVGAAVGMVARTLFGVRVRGQEIRETLGGQKALDAAVEAVRGSQLHRRDPERFESLVSQMAATGGDAVYLPIESLQTLFQSEPAELAQMLGVPLASVTEARLTGGDVAVPMATYLTRVAPEHHEALRDVVRTVPGGLTPEEAADAEAQSAEAAERFLASVRETGASDQRVYDDVSGMLLGTGRYRREDVEKYAQLVQAGFRTMAAREGRDAFELYQRYRLRIQNELPAVLQSTDIDTVIDPLIERLRANEMPSDAEAYGPTLAEFLSDKGIKPAPNEPMSGELRRLAESDRAERRGQRRLVRDENDPDALTLDYAREAAAEAGYLPADSTVDDLLNALDGEVRSEQFRNEEAAGLRDRLTALEDELDRLGIDVRAATNQDVKRALFGEDGRQVPDALVRVFDQSVFHGTPHTVDRFSLQRIGTGEGNQAFGWGLYFAGRREVAEWYAENARTADGFGGVILSTPVEHEMRRWMQEADRSGDRMAASVYDELLAGDFTPDVLRRQYADSLRDGDIEQSEHDQALAAIERAEQLLGGRGNLYQVDIPEDSDLLDYDAPLSEQPENVRAALEPEVANLRARALEQESGWGEMAAPDRAEENITGQFIYRVLADDLGPQGASQRLMELGIPGLRYLDGGSRADGDGSYNYVIWDEAAISEPEVLFQSQDQAANFDQPASDFDESAYRPEVVAWARERFGDVVAPNGNPVWQNFVAWFGDSKAVDSSGAPLTVYHGTRQMGFDRFDPERIGSDSGDGFFGHGFYFTDYREVAEGYSGSWGSGGSGGVIEAYVAARNPLRLSENEDDFEGALEYSRNALRQLDFTEDERAIIESEQVGTISDALMRIGARRLREVIEAAGFDSVHVRNSVGSMNADEWVVFQPEQIKSATDNAGTFDPADASILYQTASEDQTQTPEFRAWFGDSQVVDANGEPLVVYHGTTGDFDTFDLSRSGEFGDRFAEAAFFTSDPVVAGSYAARWTNNAEFRELADEESAALSAWGRAVVDFGVGSPEARQAEAEKDRIAAERRRVGDEIDTMQRPSDGASIVPAYLSLQNPLIVDGEGAYFFRIYEDAFSRAQEGGHDGIIFRNVIDAGSVAAQRPADVFVAFRPEQIKSATGNRGTFDPADPNILHQTQGQQTRGAIRRGYIAFTEDRQFTIGLFERADATTFLHETGHFFLEVMGDLAADPNASEGIKADYQAALDWLGVKSRDEIQTEHHEKWARGFEAYLGEGKAPTPELAPAFARFKAWVKAIYRSLTALNVTLSDDIRGVFDRLLATDQEITAAQQDMEHYLLFPDAQAAGWTADEFEQRLRMEGEAREEAEAVLMARAMDDVRRETKKWWRERQEDVRAEVAAEVHAMPVYRAWAALSRNTTPDGTPLDVEPVKLDKAWLERQYGQAWLNENLLRKRVYTVEGGVDPDVVAELFGFESGDSMVRALANMQPMEAVIRAQTHQRMIDQYGDVMTDGTMPEQAMRAVHGNRRFKAMEADARALERLAGSQPMTRDAARRTAERIIAGKRVRDLQPNSYLRAERKAAREAIAAAGKQQWTRALEAQRRRMLNAHLYDQAVKARTESEKLQRWIARFQKRPLRERLGKVNRLDQVDLILDQYDLRRLSGRQIDRLKAQAELMALIESGEVLAPPSLRRSLAGSERTNWRDMTMEDLRGLRDVLAQHEAAAKAEYETLVNGQRRLVEEDADAIADAIEQAGVRVDLSLAGETMGDRARMTAKDALVTWLRPSEIARQLDRGDNGPVTRLILQPIRRAYAEKLEPMLVKAREDVSGLYRKHYTNKELGTLNQRVRVDSLGGSYTKAELLALAMNWGNVENRQAILDSTVAGARPMTEAGVKAAFEAHLDARDWAFVQDTWKYLDTYWAEAKEVERRRRGITPRKVEADPFTVRTRDGQELQIDGGYYPLRYNPEKDSRGQKGDEIDNLTQQVITGKSVGSMTRAGSQNERVGSAGRPVWLSLQVIDSHLSSVIRDIALSEAAGHVNKVLNTRRVQQAFTATGNKPAARALDLWLKDSAAGELAAQGFFEKSSAWLRTGFTKAKIGWKISTTLLQVTGIPQTMAVVGSIHYAKGAAKWAQNPRQWHRHIMEQSAFMRARYELNAWNKDVQDTQTFLRSMFGPAPGVIKSSLETISATYFLPIAKTQMVVDETTWMAGYHKGTTERGLSHEEAVLYADSIVEEAQTSGFFADRSALERGTLNAKTRQSQFVRIWTTLASYMIAKGNIAYGKGREVVRNPSPAKVAQFGADMIMLFVIEGILAAAIRGQWPDDDEDPVALAKWAFVDIPVDAASATVPFVREVSAAKYGSGNTPIGAFSGDLWRAWVQIEQGEADLAALRAINNVGGTLFHYPAAQANVALEAYWADHQEGQDVAPYEYLTGVRKD